ncbi:MAG: hypothetical protein LBI74_08335 [Synergistaceae bacterium]|nr:hypothetical protein [Synergistaceae bacterium]
MIINIHGFRGSGDNSKYKWLQKNAAGHVIHSPTIDYENEDPKSILGRLLDYARPYMAADVGGQLDIYAVGSSFGGFYARLLNIACRGLVAILINPSLAPFLTVKDYLKTQDCKAYLELAAEYFYEYDDRTNENLHVLIGDSDEVIDHAKMTLPLLPPGLSQVHRIKGGTHRFEIANEVEEILRSIVKSPVRRGEVPARRV